MFASYISKLDVENIVVAVFFMILVESYDVLVGRMQFVIFKRAFNPEELFDIWFNFLLFYLNLNKFY